MNLHKCKLWQPASRKADNAEAYVTVDEWWPIVINLDFVSMYYPAEMQTGATGTHVHMRDERRIIDTSFEAFDATMHAVQWSQ
jgi:hypothetical protein